MWNTWWGKGKQNKTTRKTTTTTELKQQQETASEKDTCTGKKNAALVCSPKWILSASETRVGKRSIESGSFDI